MRLIIAGSRTFDDETLLFEICNDVIGLGDDLEAVIVGGGRHKVNGRHVGADYFAEKWHSTLYKVGLFPVLRIHHADWETHKLAAGPIRNREMARDGTHLVAFWDGKSKGTKNMIDEARKRKLVVKIVRYSE